MAERCAGESQQTDVLPVKTGLYGVVPLREQHLRLCPNVHVATAFVLLCYVIDHFALAGELTRWVLHIFYARHVFRPEAVDFPYVYFPSVDV